MRRVLPLLLLAGCSGPQSMLEPVGPAASVIETMWWVLFWVMTAVFILVMAALLYGIFRRRRPLDADDAGAERRRVKAVVIAGAAIPLVILVAIFVYTLEVLDAVGPSTGAEEDELTVTVVGKQFWWEIRYPVPGSPDSVVTANELHIPVGRRVRLLLESADVIHSVWVPRLTGKTDMIPGRTNRMWLLAEEPGTYWGQCAEYCGDQHTWMKMLVIAEPDSVFQRWLARQRRPALPAPPAPHEGTAQLQVEEVPGVPDSVRAAALARNQRIRQGREVFMDPTNRCADCHEIEGVTSPRDPVSDSIRRSPDGPNLTHVASRRTLAAGLLRMTRGNMAGWISNPQVLKPGNLMPRIPLEPAEMNALLEYLMSLE